MRDIRKIKIQVQPKNARVFFSLQEMTVLLYAIGTV
jgi:hypothetical protein